MSDFTCKERLLSKSVLARVNFDRAPGPFEARNSPLPSEWQEPGLHTQSCRETAGRQGKRDCFHARAHS
eukprot:3184249-Pleurochrysis_carterae.AAC.1